MQHEQTNKARWKRRVLVAGALLTLVALLLFSRGAATWWARGAALQKLRIGAIGPAQQWLAWAAEFDPKDERIDSMQAACFRHLGQREDWNRALESARAKNSNSQSNDHETDLGRLRWGEADQISAYQLQSLVRRGVSPREALTAVVQGLLAKGELTEAREFIEAWEPELNDGAQAAYLRGLCFWSAKKTESAQEQFESALEQQPAHETARASLARLLEQQELSSQALPHYAWLAQAAPDRESVQVDLARVLRKLGRADDARRVLRPPALPDDASVAVALELAEREYEAGNYREARQWFEHAELDGQHIAETLRTAASAFALGGESTVAQQLFKRVDETQARSRRAGELQRRMRIDPDDRVAASELQRLMQRGTHQDPSSAEHASPLYVRHCAACHGVDGNGQGPAAIFVFPRPRDLRASKLRLVSTLNGIPTQADIEHVIRRGIPGTSMPPFAELTREEVAELARQVQRFRQAGIRDRLAARLEQEKEVVDGESLSGRVLALMKPGEVLSIPEIDAPTSQSIERGREVYFKLGCHQCHGAEGTGAVDVLLFDDEGWVAVPRDLKHDPMKGGSDAASLYQRIRLGMPGTPHPAAAVAEESELVDLVQFCLTLAQQLPRKLTNHQREMRAATWPHSSAVGAE